MAEPAVISGGTPAFQERCGSYRSLCEAFQASVAARGDSPALAAYGKGPTLSWREAGQQVERLAGSLAALSIAEGDTVAFLLRNRPELNLLDAAALHLRAVPWSMYLTSSPEQMRVLLAGAESRVVISETDLLPRVREALDGTAVEHVIDIADFDQLPPAPAGFDFAAQWRGVGREHPLTIIWTSGTTGAPKPVELTHGSMLSTLDAITATANLRPAGRLLSALPPAHVGDRWSAYCWWITLGAEMTCVSDISEFIAATAQVHPTIWGSVPRMWEKLRAALEAQGVTAPGKLTEEAKSAIRSKLGLDAVQVLLVGAAPLAVETQCYFDDLGLPICELWGMSESTGILTFNPPDARRIGTVGIPLPGVEIKLADDGEVLARGPVLMRGYRNRPELTAATLIEGWLHTGDVGRIDEDGYLSIIDRKKELIINAAGKNMSPLAIEAALTTAGPLIGQACVIGDSRPYNVALLVLDADMLGAWGRNHAMPDADYTSLASNPDVQAAVAAEVEAANSRLSRVEQIKAWRVMDADWLPNSTELTPTMKLKRRPIAEKYGGLIDELYARTTAAHQVS